MTKATRRRTAAEIIAFYIGYDFAEMSECRYQSTRWAAPAIYVCCDTYYASPLEASQEKKLLQGYAGLMWQHVGDAYGRKIYSAA